MKSYGIGIGLAGGPSGSIRLRFVSLNEEDFVCLPKSIATLHNLKKDHTEREDIQVYVFQVSGTH